MQSIGFAFIPTGKYINFKIRLIIFHKMKTIWHQSSGVDYIAKNCIGWKQTDLIDIFEIYYEKNNNNYE